MTTETPPSVPADHFATAELATPGTRVLAFLIDWIITIPFCFIPCVGWIVAVAYGITKDCLPFLGGRSIGKRLMKIRPVTAEGASLSGNWGPGIVRNVVFMIPFFIFVELYLLFTDKEILRLGDKWAKTKVVKSEK